ncbi:MAG: acetylornithine/succinylornithine family transaminase [Chitinivibrionales bacterium]|nr:acetylornithine/succinylornithine family transaminase [Chitinivibrionales bacterium]
MKNQNPNDLFVPTYTRSAPAIVKGDGSRLQDSSGRKYLDFCSGIAVNALGHNHPALQKALERQGKKLLHASNLYFMQPQIDLAHLLIKQSFADRVFFCNSGTEAIEAAIKFARKWAGLQSDKKINILSFGDAFHGRTYGALSATPQAKFHAGFGPLMKGFYAAPLNDFAKTEKQLARREYAAIIIEPIQGESGINEAREDFLHFLREYATDSRTVLIFDEIQCGVGRTGTLWHYEQHGVIPDMMTLAKPLGGGLPLGAVLTTDEIAACISPGDHGTTFGGNPLACALGGEVIKVVSKRSFLKNVCDRGTYLTGKLQELAARRSRLVEVVGDGLMVGVRVKDDPAPIIKKCMSKGLMLIKGGNNTIRFMPPLIITQREIDKAIAIFAASI